MAFKFKNVVYIIVPWLTFMALSALFAMYAPHTIIKTEQITPKTLGIITMPKIPSIEIPTPEYAIFLYIVISIFLSIIPVNLIHENRCDQNH